MSQHYSDPSRESDPYTLPSSYTVQEDDTMKRFISSYQGSATYDVAGTRYDIRTFAFLEHSSATPEQQQIEQQAVGTVIANNWPDFLAFPSAAVMAEFPGYVAAKYKPGPTWTVEYCGSAPRTHRNATLAAIEVTL